MSSTRPTKAGGRAAEGRSQQPEGPQSATVEGPPSEGRSQQPEVCVRGVSSPLASQHQLASQHLPLANLAMPWVVASTAVMPSQAAPKLRIGNLLDGFCSRTPN